MIAEEFLNKYYDLPDSEIDSVRISSLKKFAERFEEHVRKELLKELILLIENKDLNEKGILKLLNNKLKEDGNR